MNPIIVYATPNNGVIEIPLGHTCKCYVGLVAISIPNILREDMDDNFHEINISCDQVDSSMANRKRLLRRICIQKNHDLYSTHEFKTIVYFPVDSSDKKLTIRIKDEYGPIKLPTRIARKTNPQTVTITLNVIPKDVATDQWIKYI